jgi:hypothetical protein
MSSVNSTRQVRAHRLRVGVSLLARKGGQSLWENGIFQNCLFLVQLLLKCPQVSACYLVVGGGDGDASDAHALIPDSPVPILDMRTASDALDVMIEMSAQLSPEWASAFKEKGGKLVSMRVGNDYVIDIERMIFDRPHGLLITDAPVDQVWTLPEYERTGVPYYAAVFRAPVRVVPHLWSSEVIDRAARTLPAGVQYGYQPGRAKWRLGVFEPNMCMVKTSHLPMLVADAAYRRQPSRFEVLRVFNTFHLREHATFVGFANSLDLVRHGLAGFEGRFPTYQCLATDIDAVISHHWENGQNYLYYEALHGGYPLIHNSTFLNGNGYFYPDFDCEDGALALLQAVAQHDSDIVSYRQNARDFLQTLSPNHEGNIKTYNDALVGLYSAR